MGSILTSHVFYEYFTHSRCLQLCLYSGQIWEYSPTLTYNALRLWKENWRGSPPVVRWVVTLLSLQQCSLHHCWLLLCDCVCYRTCAAGLMRSFSLKVQVALPHLLLFKSPWCPKNSALDIFCNRIVDYRSHTFVCMCVRVCVYRQAYAYSHNNTCAHVLVVSIVLAFMHMLCLLCICVCCVQCSYNTLLYSATSLLCSILGCEKSVSTSAYDIHLIWHSSC